MIGPVFIREAVTTPRRPRHYLYRSVYVAALMILMCTAWLALAGTQLIRDVGDMARFGSSLFHILAPLQLTLVVFLSALRSASAVAQEKDRRTLVLLLLTRMSNAELVLGKLAASLLDVLVMLAAAAPVFLLVTLFGGVSFVQVGRVFAVTLAAAAAAGSLGSTLAFWREKTFQTLSMTALALLMWAGVWEAVHAGVLGDPLLGVSCRTWAAACSPFRAVFEAARPDLPGAASANAAWLFLGVAAAVGGLLNLAAILRVRVWNPSREVRRGQRDESAPETIWGAEHDLAREREAPGAEGAAEAARSAHVDARRNEGPAAPSRRVWDNPILWREICTWAYGRKVLAIRVAYLLLFAMAAAGLHAALGQDAALGAGDAAASVVPGPARPLAPFFLVSLVIVNALAVTSITNERDGLALDLLLVTDLTPREFVFGKLGGVLWVAKEMVLLPMLLCLYLWGREALGFENLCFLLTALSVLNIFAIMLGIHCGMHYASSRNAIGVSLGAVFFLFLGVVTCIAVMISFSGSFQQQLPAFLAFILGGGVGLYVSLGARNPSPAIALASLLLPLATFHAITSILLDYNLTAFLVVTAVYAFTTAAMLIPAVYEFDIAMGRTKTAEDE